MKPKPLILLSAFLLLPTFADALLIFIAIAAYPPQGVGHAQNEYQVYEFLQFYGVGASILSLLGLHFCSRAGFVGRHPLHIGFIVTAAFPFFIYLGYLVTGHDSFFSLNY
jgi:hypothetical protein